MAREKKDIFRFKEFAVSNCRSAMRVGTDGVLLGAWTPVSDNVKCAWDVGSGTGVVGLMIAQRAAQCCITGIEIDAEAAAECADNMAASPWADRMDTICGDILELAGTLEIPDLIVSNPPYFYTGEHAPGHGRALARHASAGGLGAVSLVDIASRTLSDHGRLCMIVPAELEDRITLACTLSGLEPEVIVDVCARHGRPAMRQLWSIGRCVGDFHRGILYVRDEDGGYSDEYKRLTSPFYLDVDNNK